MGEQGQGPHRSQEQRRAFHLRVQRSRALVYASGVAVAAVARLVGVIDLSWLVIAGFLLAACATVVITRALIIRKIERLGPVTVQALWMAADVGLFLIIVGVSGGSASPWFPWALANVSAAAFVVGRRGALTVMAANLVGYLLIVLLFEGMAAATLLIVVFKMLVLYAASVFAVLGICDLQQRRLQISRLREHESRRTIQLRGLMATLEERNQQLARLTDELRKVAVTDPLTGLPNRRYLKERIQEDLALLRRALALGATKEPEELADRVTEPEDGGKPYPGEARRPQTEPALAFVMLDLDGFKEINDQHGHDAGDEVLRQVASIMGSKVRGLDSVVRWGGDELLVILRHIHENDLMAVVRRLIVSIRRAPFDLRDLGIARLTCSAGFCIFPLGSLERPSWEDSVKIADRALRLAKERGGDQAVGVFKGQRQLDRAGLSFLSRDLDAALAEGYIRVELDSHRFDSIGARS